MAITLRRFLPIMLAVATAAVAVPAMGLEERPPEAPATALRVVLGRALGEHAFLLGEVIRSGVADAPDFDAAADALGDNSADVIGAIEDVYGADAAAAFGEQWNNHVGYIVDYGRALANGDADAAQLASEQLDRYVADFGGFLADALPALPPDAVEGLIGEHVQQLEHVASFSMEDFVSAYGAIRETYAHMFAVGDGLTVGIVSRFPDRFTGRDQAFSPASDLRQTLDRLLGEHTYLAALAMRAILRGETTGETVEAALAANSDELRGTIDSVYGAEAGEAFASLWDEHDAAYVAYVAAVADGQESAAAAALDALAQHRMSFSGYVAEVNPFLSGDAFAALMANHTDNLVRQTDAYDAGEYDLAHDLAREAYVHAGEMSASLAGAIADQFPQLFPDAAVPRSALPIDLIGAGMLALSAALLAARLASRSSRSPTRRAAPPA